MAQPPNLGGHSFPVEKPGVVGKGFTVPLRKSMREKSEGSGLVFDDNPYRMDYARDIA
jgi:hypothetical protein